MYMSGSFRHPHTRYKHTSTHVRVRFRMGVKDMTTCKKDTDAIDPGQLELIEQLNNSLAGGMTTQRTTDLMKERSARVS